jgi:probable phosphoglycerate mutase
MRKLVLFRHGETDLNRDHRVQGVSDYPLNSVGIKQAEDLALRLKNQGISHIVSSDLKRAHQTASIVAISNVCPITIYPELREQNYGQIERQPLADVRQQYVDICKIMDDNGHPLTNSVVFPDAESRMDVFLRVSGRLESISRTFSDVCIGVSTHAGVIASLMGVEFNKKVHLRNGEHLILFYDGNHFVDYEI